MRARLVVVAALLALAGPACGKTITLDGVDLPVAATPALAEGGTWAVAFTADFPSGFWPPGEHRYRMLVDCPALATEYATAAISFQSTELVPVQPRSVYLRAAGLSNDILLPPLPGAIHPAQPTIAALTVIGNNRDAADQAVSTCTGTIEYDGTGSTTLSPIEPFQP
jgi:hypothetical protein